MTTVLLLVAACDPDVPGGKHPADPTTTTGCPTGEVLDGEVCVPEACGTGTWGRLPVDGDTVYVAQDGDGDGSEGSPFGSIQAALDLAGERNGGLVAVAAGTYLETVSMGTDHDGVTLAGRCRELVTIDGSEGEQVPAIWIVGGRSRRPEIGIEGVTVTGGRYAGVQVERASVTAERVDLVANTVAGVLVAEAHVALASVSVWNTQPDRRGDFGWGIAVEASATLTATGCFVEGNTGVGLYVAGDSTSVDLDGVVVRGTLESADGSPSYGIGVGDGAALFATDCTVQDSAEVGILAIGEHTRVELVDTVVDGTAPSSSGSGGVGMAAQGGATLAATGCTVVASTGVGVVGYDAGTTVELVGTVVQDTALSPEGSHGWGIEVIEGATLTATGCTVDGNSDVGVTASDDGTTVELVDTVVRDTAPNPDGTAGLGINVDDGATLTATGCTVEGNAGVGVYAGNDGTTVELVDAVVRDTAPSPDASFGGGVIVQDGATLRATDCTVGGNTNLGVAAAGEGTTVELVDTVVRETAPMPNGSNGVGLAAQEGATLTATGCTVEGNTAVGVYAALDGTTVHLVDTAVQETAPAPDGSFGRGINVQDGATLTASGCTVEGNHEFSVFASGDGATVELVDMVVRDTRRGVVTGFALGVAAGLDATATLDACVVSGTEGPGLYAIYGANLSVTSTTVATNTFAGAVILDAVVTLDDVTITDTAPDAQWGGGFGVYANDQFGRPSLTLTHSTIGPHPYAAVWLDGDGTYLLEDNDLSGNVPFDLRGRLIHGNALFAERGVRAWDGTTGLALVGNRLHGATDVAVLLDASSAWLDGNTFESNGTDVWQQRCDGVTPLVTPDLDWVVCDGGTLLTDSATQFTTLYLPEVEPE